MFGTNPRKRAFGTFSSRKSNFLSPIVIFDERSKVAKTPAERILHPSFNKIEIPFSTITSLFKLTFVALKPTISINPFRKSEFVGCFF